MIIPDVNLLVYACDSGSRRHEAACDWWEALMNGTGSVGIPWIVILGFIRIATHSRILDNPLEVGSACAHVRIWLARPNAIIVHPGARHRLHSVLQGGADILSAAALQIGVRAEARWRSYRGNRR